MSTKSLEPHNDVRYSQATPLTNNSETDATYTAILKEAFEDPSLSSSDREEMKLILDTIVCTQEPLSVDLIVGLLRLDNEALVRSALRRLESVLQVSDMTDTVTGPKESFSDYLLDKLRSDVFYCDFRNHNTLLARRCFDQLRTPDPPFNICNLESSYLFDSDVPDLSIRIDKIVSKELFYACCYWESHLELAADSQDLGNMLLEFLSERFLLWMEVMSLKRCIHDGAKIFYRAQHWVNSVSYASDSLKSILRDAWMFATAFSCSPATLSTPHIYVSTLSFWPDDRPISKHYPQQQPRIIQRASTAMSLRGTIPLAIIQTAHPVFCLAYSPDGIRAVSGSGDHAVRIWDPHTGQAVGQPLEAHTDTVSSLTYSPDGMNIASGSFDHVIHIWDVHTGQQVQSLKGHIKAVRSVAYSPSGQHIISGSDDCMVRIWDAHAGRKVGEPCVGHTGAVLCVAYSPEGAYIASSSYDHTIRIWSAHTGQLIGQPLEGHTDAVRSVAYAPHGAHIVSGSCDKTIRIWDGDSGQPVGRPLEGHADAVNCVAYSPDGAYIVSGSSDCTIRVWDANTRQTTGQIFRGHASTVSSVIYSPDGAYILSSSSDASIRVWDVRSDAETNQVPHRNDNEAQTTNSDSTILNPQYAEPHVAWELKEDGWVVDSDSRLLVWVPPDLRDVLRHPADTAPVSERGFLRLDINRNRIGDHWHEQFRPTRSFES